jgi:hypothetical protein
MDSNSWLFVFAAIQAIGVLLAFFRVDVRILEYLRPGTTMPLVSRREWFMAILAIGSVVVSAVGWNRIEPDLPEFDSPQQVLLQGWMAAASGQGAGFCNATVNGDRLWSYRNGYKLASGCLIWDGLGEFLDAPNVQQSPLYDIKHGSINLRAQWGEGFPKYMAEKHATGNFVAVFLVPNGVAPTQFSTLRQARALGVRIIAMPLTKIGLAQ